MISKFHSIADEHENDHNLFSKVLNGMKSVFNNTSSTKKTAHKKNRQPKANVKCQSEQTSADCSTSEPYSIQNMNDSAVLIPILNDTSRQIVTGDSTMNDINFRPVKQESIQNIIVREFIPNAVNITPPPITFESNLMPDCTSTPYINHGFIQAIPATQSIIFQDNSIHEIPTSFIDTNLNNGSAQVISIINTNLASVMYPNIIPAEPIIENNFQIINPSIMESNDVMKTEDVHIENPMEHDNNTEEFNSSVSENNKIEESSKCPYVENVDDGSENNCKNKPRIVLKFRSEKSGSNMKIVSDDEKFTDINKSDIVSRRSLRAKNSSSQKHPIDENQRKLKKNDQSQSEESQLADVKSSVSNESNESLKTPSSTPRKKRGGILPLSDSMSEDASSLNPEKYSTKRSINKRPKEFCEDVIVNSIARREKFNEGVNSGHTRLSRRIKPTAKILANRELRIGLETQNNARLGLVSERSFNSEGKLTRSKLKRSPEKFKASLCELEKNTNDKSKCKKSSKINSTKEDKKSSAIDENSESHHNDLTSDVKLDDESLDKQNIDNSKDKIDFSSKLAVNKNSYEEEKERRRINKLKKKHLKKLGLKAVSTHTQMLKDREIVTDESTMDSTNTEAIIEHLNNREKILSISSDKLRKPNEVIDPKVVLTDDLAINSNKTNDSKKNKSNKVTKRKVSTSESENSNTNENVKFENDDYEEIPVRITRKRSRMDCLNSTEQNDPPKTSLENEDTTDKTMSCFCDKSSNLYTDPASLSDIEFCRAVEYINGQTVGCGKPISSSKLLRASYRAPFFLACNMHHQRLILHHCCAGCGVFCSQGAHYQCDKGHLFHWECSLPFVSLLLPAEHNDQPSSDNEQPPSHPRGTLTDLYNSEPGCPHCGVDPSTKEPINTKCHKINLEMKCSNPMILLPNPRLQWIPARMSFSTPSLSKNNNALKTDIEAIIPRELLCVIKSSIEKLNYKQDTVIDYDDLLIKVNKIQRHMNLIKAVCEKENTVENIIEAINAGGDPKKHIPHVDNGTFMHLAARELNLCALHIFKILGCDLDALDGENRTPLMLAVMNYDTEIMDKLEDDSNESINDQQNESTVTDESKHISNIEVSGEFTENKNTSPIKDLVGSQKEYRMVIEYLLKAGSDTTIKGPNGATVLHLAAKYGDILTCSTIINNYTNCKVSFVNQKDDGGWTPLVWAVENKRNDVVRFLLENGADPMSRDLENNIALHWAAMAGCNKVMQDLLEFGSQVDIPNSRGETPLHISARQSNYGCLIILLARGAQINLKNSVGETALECVGDETGDCYSALLINKRLQQYTETNGVSNKSICLDISNGKENNPVRCINSVDDETLDGKFTYITQNCFTIDVNIDRKISSMQTCQCKDGCGMPGADCACTNLSMQSWYDINGRLVSNFDYNDPPIIFECNDACSCNKLHCINRCLDKAPRVSLKVFRHTETTIRGVGWGVCSTQSILKGTLVSEYVGEILPGVLAYHRSDDSYLFELDMKDNVSESQSEPYCIDAKNYGNVSRFINHKCEPNIIPVRVFVDHRDLNFPRIAFFACKDIAADEELGFDYGAKFWSVKIKSFTCNCNSPACRYNKVPEEPTNQTKKENAANNA